MTRLHFTPIFPWDRVADDWQVVPWETTGLSNNYSRRNFRLESYLSVAVTVRRELLLGTPGLLPSHLGSKQDFRSSSKLINFKYKINITDFIWSALKALLNNDQQTFCQVISIGLKFHYLLQRLPDRKFIGPVWVVIITPYFLA